MIIENIEMKQIRRIALLRTVIFCFGMKLFLINVMYKIVFIIFSFKF